MKLSSRSVIALVAALGLVSGAAFAQGHGMMHGMGPGMMGGMGHGAGGHGPMAGAVHMLTRQDEGSDADMALVRDLLTNHTRIKRTVTNLPDGTARLDVVLNRPVRDITPGLARQTYGADVYAVARRVLGKRERKNYPIPIDFIR